MKRPFVSLEFFDGVPATIRRTRARTASALLLSCFASAALAQSEPRPTEPGGNATKPVNEQNDLGQKLIRRTIDQGEEDPMAAITRLMDESTRKLQIDFDPGDITQSVQRQIVERLDKAIETSAAQRRSRRQGQPQQGSDKRRMARRESDSPRPKRGDTTPSQGGGDDETSAAPLTGEGREPVHGEIKDTRRAWGNLPQRERDELIQGFDEAFIERYREWIRRYYQTLQETGK